MFDFENLKIILDNFNIDGDFSDFHAIDDGHINNTFCVSFSSEGKSSRYLLQRVNTTVFKNPEALMSNVDIVTAFLRKKITEAGGNPERETLYCIPTKNGTEYFIDEDGGFWRVYNFVENSFSYNSIESPEIFFNAGKAFGDFQRQLADFPSEELSETIPDFHNTAKRYYNLMCSVKADKAGRVKNVPEEIAFAQARKDETYVLIGKIATGDLPLRVTHNDTKLNNILFDKDTHAPICVVDLDTVMPGLSLYDFGDAIRFGANTAAEDEKDVSKVALDLNLYEQYVRGFLTSAGESLYEEEVRLLPFSAKMMTLECGMRFLTDYLDGDVYFRVNYPEHNLVRCHTQFALVADMEKKFDSMIEITRKAYQEICSKTF